MKNCEQLRSHSKSGLINEIMAQSLNTVMENYNEDLHLPPWKEVYDVLSEKKAASNYVLTPGWLKERKKEMNIFMYSLREKKLCK